MASESSKRPAVAFLDLLGRSVGIFGLCNLGLEQDCVAFAVDARFFERSEHIVDVVGGDRRLEEFGLVAVRFRRQRVVDRSLVEHGHHVVATLRRGCHLDDTHFL